MFDPKNWTYGWNPFDLSAGEQIVFLVLLVWSLALKGPALWKAARRGEKHWFAALLIVNSVGILEILYLYVFSKKTRTNEARR